MDGLIETIKSLDILTDEPVKTNIPAVSIFKSINYMPRQPFLYDPSVCFLLQGQKYISLGEDHLPYDADNYLVISVVIPMEAEVLATPENPVIGILVDIEMSMLHELISITGHPFGLSGNLNQSAPKAVEPARMDVHMKNTIERMAGCLKSKVEARALGDGLVREVLYRVLCGPQASALYALANHNGPFARIAHVLKVIQTKYAEKLDIEYLAGEARMGVTAFHQSFKQVTSESPMQYLKKVRLTQAKDLIMREKEKVYIAADTVGYESTSQFSREFKRLFGKPPSAFTGIPGFVDD
ncbi:AraC family transcriptional regulator [uncultured Desulfobacter sp.]|uniref:AraC family transcriptional regulator n=1 Tax=uncultured Desulfobacter sp. TaxID=240139 RepID=UPI0029F46921|nr:AraC family transcriptional regulator [uncultured Desulfobacter sp.]